MGNQDVGSIWGAADVQEGNEKGGKDIGSVVLRVLGWLGIAGWVLSVCIVSLKGYQPRFQTDNAIGATANALEMIQLMLMSWLGFFGAVLFFVLASLRDIRLQVASNASLLKVSIRSASVRAKQSSPPNASLCPKCYAPLDPGVRFCVKCGTKI